MPDSSSSHGLLYSLYEQYVGEPHSVTDVYGYWVFVLGYLIAIAGIVAFLVEMSTGAFTQLLLREAAYVLAALALPLALFGVVLILPVQRWGLYGAALGLAIAVPGVAWFATVYPEGWGADEANIAIIAVYSAGVALIAGVTILIPVITGKRSALAEIIEKATSEPEPEPEPQVVEPEIEPDEEQSPVVLGQTHRGALFAVFHTGTEWSWRLIEEEAIADTPSQYSNPQATEEGAERVKSLIDSAGMLETADAAFRLYQTDEDDWGWVLMRENGEIVAEGDDDFESRNAVEESVNLLKEYGPESAPLSFEGATIDYDRDGGRWRWRLLDESRDELAVSPDTYADKTDAVRSASAMREAADGGQILTLDDYGIELYREETAVRTPERRTEADGGVELPWRWRLIDADDTVLATGNGSHESRGAVETAAHDLLDRIGNAAMLEAGEPVYEIAPEGAGEWHWRLVGAGTSAIARSRNTDSQANTEQTAKTMRANAADADVFVVDGTSFEVYDADDGWRWRLVDEDRTPIAVGDHRYPDRESATEAVETVCDQVPEAELIEFDTAAFQIYEAGEQSTDPADEEAMTEWRWRLIDEDGDVLADSGDDYGTRSQALDSMNTLKQYAPDAELLEVDTVAFELYDDDEVWYWRLIDENGDLLARSGEGYPSRTEARGSMDRLIGSAPETETRAMDSAGFQVYDEDDAWHWQFVMPSGPILAESTDDYATRDQAFAAIDDLRPDAARAGLATIEDLVVRIVQSENGWRWQVVDRADDLVADGARTYESRDQLEAELAEIRRVADDIIVFEMDDPVFRIGTNGGWHWQLIDGDRSVFARSPDTSSSEEAARESIDRVRRLAPGAESTDYDPAAFELVDAEDGWHWQLVDEDREVIATGTDAYDTREDTRDGIDAVKSVLGDANIFEFDHAMFELRESSDGWRWHLTDANGDLVGRSLDAYPTRNEARQAMRTVKHIGPDARVAVAGAAE